MPAVLASVQKRRWRRALPAVTQTTLRVAGKQANFILGLFESGSVECRAGAPAPVRRPLRCAEAPASGSGGVARRGCSERGPHRRPSLGALLHMYLHTTTKNLARRAPSSRRCSRGWTWRRRQPIGTATGRSQAVRRGPLARTCACRRLLPSGLPHCGRRSLPPAHVHGQNRPLSRVFLGRTRIP